MSIAISAETIPLSTPVPAKNFKDSRQAVGSVMGQQKLETPCEDEMASVTASAQSLTSLMAEVGCLEWNATPHWDFEPPVKRRRTTSEREQDASTIAGGELKCIRKSIVCARGNAANEKDESSLTSFKITDPHKPNDSSMKKKLRETINEEGYNREALGNEWEGCEMPERRSSIFYQIMPLLQKLSELRKAYPSCVPSVSFRWHWLRIVTAKSAVDLIPYQVILDPHPAQPKQRPLRKQHASSPSITDTARRENYLLPTVALQIISDLHCMFINLCKGAQRTAFMTAQFLSSTMEDRPSLAATDCFTSALLNLTCDSVTKENVFDECSASIFDSTTPSIPIPPTTPSHISKSCDQNKDSCLKFEPLETPSVAPAAVHPTPDETMNLIQRAFYKGIWRIKPNPILPVGVDVVHLARALIQQREAFLDEVDKAVSSDGERRRDERKGGLSGSEKRSRRSRSRIMTPSTKVESDDKTPTARMTTVVTQTQLIHGTRATSRRNVRNTSRIPEKSPGVLRLDKSFDEKENKIEPSNISPTCLHGDENSNTKDSSRDNASHGNKASGNDYEAFRAGTTAMHPNDSMSTDDFQFNGNTIEAVRELNDNADNFHDKAVQPTIINSVNTEEATLSDTPKSPEFKIPQDTNVTITSDKTVTCQKPSSESLAEESVSEGSSFQEAENDSSMTAVSEAVNVCSATPSNELLDEKPFEIQQENRVTRKQIALEDGKRNCAGRRRAEGAGTREKKVTARVQASSKKRSAPGTSHSELLIENRRKITRSNSSTTTESSKREPSTPPQLLPMTTSSLLDESPATTATSSSSPPTFSPIYHKPSSNVC